MTRPRPSSGVALSALLLATGCGDASIVALESAERCGSSGSTAVLARPAADFTDFVGVGLRLGYAHTPYADHERVAAALIELGVRHVAEVAADAGELSSLSATGVSALLLDMDPERPRDLDVAPVGMLDLVQPIAPALPVEASAQDWQGALSQDLSKVQLALDARPQLGRVRVVAPALPQNILEEVAGAWPPVVDVNLVTRWPGAAHPGAAELEAALTALERLQGSGPRMATQVGYSTSTAGSETDPASVASEVVQGKYLVRLLLNLFQRGWERVYLAQLVDWQGADRAFADRLGLVRADFSPKPAFVALRNLLQLLADAGNGSNPSGLAFDFEGGTAGLRHVLLQDTAQRFFLIVWLELPSTDEAPDKQLEHRVVLQVTTPIESATTYHPEQSTFADARSTAQELPLILSDWPTVIELVPRCP